MKPSLILFVVVLILGTILGYSVHEARNIKVQYERDSCYIIMKEHLSTTNPDITKDLDLGISEYPLKYKTSEIITNGIYGWYCADSSTYEPATIDESTHYLNRGCELYSINIYNTTNRSTYIQNGWVDYGKQ